MILNEIINNNVAKLNQVLDTLYSSVTNNQSKESVLNTLSTFVNNLQVSNEDTFNNNSQQSLYSNTSFKFDQEFKDIVEKSNTKWKETEWEFPKGRRNYQEKDLDCAFREFEEETGISKSAINIIENVIPFEEIFIGTNHKSYKHKYFLAYSKENVCEDNLENYQKSEVSKLEWKTIDECLESIRPYSLEKKQLITNINKVLQEYRLYS